MTVKVQYVSGIQYFVEFTDDERILFQKIIKEWNRPSAVVLEKIIVCGLINIGHDATCKEY